VALANKNARILWSMLVNGRSFDPEYTIRLVPAVAS
jgi:hypothetical protein